MINKLRKYTILLIKFKNRLKSCIYTLKKIIIRFTAFNTKKKNNDNLLKKD